VASRPFTPAWAAGFQTAINGSDAYRQAARGWTWPLALVLLPVPELGYPEGAALLADLHEGSCRDVRLVPPDSVQAPFVLRGSYGAWKRLIVDGGDPVTAIVKGRLALSGSLATIIRYLGASRALVACARAVPTAFPDDPEPATPPR
jgi:putative sterol carrier protein